MTSEETATSEDPQISFKVKTSSDGNHSITIAETATVLDLKTKLAGSDYENVSADRQRLIYSGRVMKNEEPLSTYKIKAGNTIHMVRSAQSNVAQNPASSGSPAAAGSTLSATARMPTNMATGTANNPLAGLTGARFAGHMGLPGTEMFGADGGMGAPPSEEDVARLLDDPNYRQNMNEALSNPAVIDIMINSNPILRNMGPRARELLQSPMFRQMMTNPDTLRHASQLQRAMEGGGGPSAFPAPGVTDTTPAGAAGSNSTPNQPNTTPVNPFMMGGPFGGAGGAGGNPFAQLFGGGAMGQTPAQTPPAPGSVDQGIPSANADSNTTAANPFASLFGGAGAGGTGAGASADPFGMQGMPPMTPEMMQQAMEMLHGGGRGGFGGAGEAGSPRPPADTRPPEERYADQLRQLNDMGFFDFDRNVEALRRSGGSVQGAIEQLLT